MKDKKKNWPLIALVTVAFSLFLVVASGLSLLKDVRGADSSPSEPLSFPELMERDDETITEVLLYHHALEDRPEPFYDVERWLPPLSGAEKYNCPVGDDVIGAGSFGSVKVCTNVLTDEKVCVKTISAEQRLKETQLEVKIMRAVQGGENIVQFIDMVESPEDSFHFVLEYIPHKTHRVIFSETTPLEAKFYLKEFLLALDAAHSRGVMHRDLKAQNVLIDHGARRLTLIDFGLSDFFRYGEANSLGMGTRNYQGPELFLLFPFYDFGLDMWAFGNLAFSFLFRKQYLIRSWDEEHKQLEEIMRFTGWDEILEFRDKYQDFCSDRYLRLVDPERKKTGRQRASWEQILGKEVFDATDPLAFDFLDRLLKVDVFERMSAKEALQHPFLADVLSLTADDILSLASPKHLRGGGKATLWEEDEENRTNVTFPLFWKEGDSEPQVVEGTKPQILPDYS